MEGISFTLLISLLVLASLAACYIDYRYNLHLVDWFNGRCKNPFTSDQASEQRAHSQTNQDQQTIAELKERIAILEKIVTEPAYELNQKINQLK